MKISCITTVFNDGELLLNSIHSVLNQTYEDFQYIIVDDGSAKDTRDIVQSIKDPRVLVVQQANDGLSGARNKGLEQVTGEYVCFLDADDTRPTWAFQVIADVIQRDDPDLIFCRGALSEVRGQLLPFYDSGKFDIIQEQIGDDPIRSVDPENARLIHLAQLLEPQSANKIVRSSMLKKRHLGFPNTHFFEDIFFHTGVLAQAQKISFIHSPCFTYFRRYHRPQITATSGDLRFDIIPVTKLTLEVFATRPQFHDPLHRAAVFSACFKLLKWCEQSISYSHRHHFRELTQALLHLMDPLYLEFPDDIPEDMFEVKNAQTYIKTLGFNTLSSPTEVVEEVPYNEKPHNSRVRRFWQKISSGHRA